MNLTPDDFRQLDERGYLLLEEVLAAPQLAVVRARVNALFAEEGDAAGSEFKQEAGCRRLANLVDKGEVFHELLLHPRVTPLVSHTLGADFKLASNNARSINPHSDRRQPLHADMGATPDAGGPWVFNTIWMLDDFTAENGALRAVPGSHLWGKLPGEALTDPLAPHPEEVLLTGRAGSVLAMNAHLWHGGLENRTAAPRTAVHVFYCRRDKPQQQHQKSLVRPAVQERLPQRLRSLLALDDAENDRLFQEAQVRSGFLK